MGTAMKTPLTPPLINNARIKKVSVQKDSKGDNYVYFTDECFQQRCIPLKNFHKMGGILALHEAPAHYGRGAFCYFTRSDAEFYRAEPKMIPAEIYI